MTEGLRAGSADVWVWVAGLHALATCLMTGLVWFVQVVHYPLMARVGREGFAEYAREHAARTTRLVMPLMLLELASGCGLAWQLRGGSGAVVGWVALGLLVVVWVSTFAVQVPLHERLAAGYSPAVLGALVRTNWVRTVLWSSRSVLAVWMVQMVAAGTLAVAL